MTKPLPNWDIWLKMPNLTAHQAVCLSLGLDPTKVQEVKGYGDIRWVWTSKHLTCEVSDFDDRLTLFKACHAKAPSAVELSKWAQSVNWNIPLPLAELAPRKQDTPECVPADSVRAALLTVLASSGDIDELEKELARAGITFAMRDSMEMVEIPDGTVNGARKPLSNLYQALLAPDLPNRQKISSLVKGCGASGSGAFQSRSIEVQAPHHTKVDEPMGLFCTSPELQQTAPATDTAMPAPVVAESTEQRRARWLNSYGKGERGAVQRVYKNELKINPSADRSFIGKEIRKARAEKAETDRAGNIYVQLIQNGKRKS